jgi:hypothetical protein
MGVRYKRISAVSDYYTVFSRMRVLNIENTRPFDSAGKVHIYLLIYPLQKTKVLLFYRARARTRIKRNNRLVTIVLQAERS